MTVQEFTIKLPIYTRSSMNLSKFIESLSSKGKHFYAVFTASGITFTLSNPNSSFGSTKDVVIPLSALSQTDECINVKKVTSFVSKLNILSSLAENDKSAIFSLTLIEDTTEYPLSKKVLKATLCSSNPTTQKSINTFRQVLED